MFKNDFKMLHMTDVGISGLDLYQKRYDDWYFISTGIPEGMNNESYLYKRFKRKFDKTGKLKSVRERQAFVKPSVKHRNKIIKASYIQKLRDKEASL